MKKTSFLIGILLLIAVLIPSAVLAFNVKTADSVYIEKDEVVEGNMYVVSKNITIEGVVNGDLIALAQNITVKGKIAGDIISVSQNLNVEGEISGNIRSIANTASLIDTTVKRNLNLIGTNVLIGENSNISWDALVLAGVAEMRGTVQGSLHGVVDKLIISGDVNKDVSFTINESDDYFEGKAIEIAEGTNIQGNFDYSYSENLNLDESLIAGTLNFNEKSVENNWQKNIWNFIISIFSALVVGLVLISISKKEMAIIQEKVNSRYGKSLLIGLGILFLTPIISIILMMTIIGIPLGFIMLIIWFIALYFAQIMVGLGLGKQIREKVFKLKKKNIMADLIIGITTLYLLFAIPVFGGVLTFFSTLLGLGVIWRYKKFRISSLK
ncbi:polymer-forming cytoskeletal protein [Patescibacteria group bacterium]|nr:polymer-forming cytoskeletal protein [Patescibacteria group bacterium]